MAEHTFIKSTKYVALGLASLVDNARTFDAFVEYEHVLLEPD